MYCGNCSGKSQNRATFHCYDCKEHLCAGCNSLHEALRVNKSHKIVPVEDLLSEKAVDDNRYCKEHQIVVEFYCETEQSPVCSHCVSLGTCHTDHKRIGLQDAGKKLFTSVIGLLTEYDRLKQEHESAFRKTEQVRKDLKKSKESALSLLSKVQKDNIQLLNDIYKQDADKIDKDNLGKLKKIGEVEHHLKENLAKVEEAHQRAIKAGYSDSDYEITSTYSMMVKGLEVLNKLPIEAADEELGHIDCVPVPPVMSPKSHLLLVRREWKGAGKFGTKPHMKDLCGLAINQDGDIAVTSIRNGVSIFKRTGQLKCAFKDSPDTVLDIAVTPDNRYIIDGKDTMFCYDNEGHQLSKITTTDLKMEVCKPYGIAVDKQGRIIAALRSNCVSIHYSDGIIINNIGIQKTTPWRIDVTSLGELVVSCVDKTLKLMDYSGGNVRDIQPPPGITKWNPGYVTCCEKYGEIFVGNVGVPKAVYSFTSDGEYIGVVTDDVDMPQGIAVSKDGQELMVAELNENRIKTFSRQ